MFPVGTPKDVQNQIEGGVFYSWQCCPTCLAISERIFADWGRDGEPVDTDDLNVYVDKNFGGDWGAADKWATKSPKGCSV